METYNLNKKNTNTNSINNAEEGDMGCCLKN